MSKCEQITELLAAFADGGLSGAEREGVERHVAGCAACRGEVAALRETLAAVKAAPAEATAGAKDEAFWQDFGRDTRLAYDRAVEQKAGRRWLPSLWWSAPLVLGAAAILVVIFTGIGRRHGKEEAGLKPVPDAGVAVGVQTGLADQLGPEDVNDMTDEQLDRVLSALDDEEDEGEATDADPAAGETAEPYEAIEELDDDEIERVLDALTKGV